MENTSDAIQLVPEVSSHDHIQGSLDAPVTLVEYGDFQCPYCRQAQSTVKKLQQKFQDQLCFVFRNYPLVESHPNAEHAAEAAEIAASQGKFWEMYQLLFDHQNELDDAHLVKYAEQLGIDRALFIQAMTDGNQIERIRKDMESGDQSGVPATPTFFINGVRYEDTPDVETMAQAIERVLEKHL
ncbi:hypothetical protein KDA_58330 [Dictyobacter alpinus]|uniref:Thioredoxin domain-containing protein n=1 Tax=Dictyobacter alpinus TaxID=2014873 RepID=A0A402BG97_9CHLR|nr:thioredoxin domain-containing protein [Dictyobacter alpinus]GCE30317.1 hypothetical protein KDA_58010 [Dictyobacter alpinus]GCE30349.1 hypothetical protein KDA_58330 [Dictyobacter alpinus]